MENSTASTVGQGDTKIEICVLTGDRTIVKYKGLTIHIDEQFVPSNLKQSLRKLLEVLEKVL